jgi:ATP-dependent Lon protease
MKDKEQFFPLLPLKGSVVFPNMTIPLYIGRSASLLAVKECLNKNSKLVVVSQRDTKKEDLKSIDLYRVGVLGEIIQNIHLPDGNVKVLFKAQQKIQVQEIVFFQSYFQVAVKTITPDDFLLPNTPETKRVIREKCSPYLARTKKPAELESIIQKLEQNPSYCNFFCASIDFSLEQKQKLLEAPDVLKQIELLLESVLKLEQKKNIPIHELQPKTKWKNKEQYLKEHFKVIKQELKEQQGEEKQEYKKKIAQAKLPEAAAKVVLEEAEKLESTASFSAEANIIKNYIDWIFKVPWHHQSKENLNLKKAEKILDINHHGLEKVKERILEFIAVLKVVGKLKGPILCLVGPPGVGKSTLAKTVAEALGRKFQRISLGGIRDEAEIRGHRRTYIGAMPGKMIQTMKKVGVTNPLILLDEVDKISASHLGDPSSALLEVLDIEQNHSFADNYLELDYDLSKVLFFCTANDVSQIPPALLDRMEVIFLNGYTEIEKMYIFQKHLLPRITKENGLDAKQVAFPKMSILKMVQNYTREAGIRELERNLAKVCRKITRQFLAKEEKSQKIAIDEEKLQIYLGTPKYAFEAKNKKNFVGVATGLAWTNYGGDILFIETSCMKGKGNIQLTGKLGEVMQESARAAWSFVKSNASALGIYDDIFEKLDLHIHLPEGATPKDGPSAGAALITALVSNLTNIPVRSSIAVTGEISLQGRLLGIGGLQPKLLASKRARINKVIIPADNEKDLADIPSEIRKGLNIQLAKNVWEVLKIMLTKTPQPINEKDLIQKNKNYWSLSKRATNFIIPAPGKLTK